MLALREENGLLMNQLNRIHLSHSDNPPHPMQVLALREENELLMDQLVTTKVRLAETEGEFLRSKRELLRAEEKQQQVRKGGARATRYILLYL